MSSSFSVDLVALSKRMSKLKDLDEGKKGNDVFHRQPVRGILKKPGVAVDPTKDSENPFNVSANQEQASVLQDYPSLVSTMNVNKPTLSTDEGLVNTKEGDQIRASSFMEQSHRSTSAPIDVEEVAWSSKPTGNDPISTTETPIVQSVDIGAKPSSYAGAAGASNTNKLNERINVFSMVAENRFEGVNISIPRKVVEKVSTRYENTLYGYFIGKRMAFPVVEYYVKNNWNKYGLKRIMMNAKGFFFFQFNTRDGLDDVLEGGPWMIRNSPIILKEWTMKTSLHKEELTSIPVWVKFHDVPIQIFEEEGISLIATYIGKPIMLDSFTSSMCKESWGRSSFARVLIEIASDSDFKENIIVGVPDLDGLGESCPKRVVAAPEVTNIVRDDHDDGFQQVRNRKRNSKGNTKGKQAIPRGVPMSKGFQVGKEFAFNPKATVLDSNGGSKSAANSKASSSSSLNKGNLDTHSNVSKPGPSITTNDRHSAAHLNDGGKKSIVIDSNSNLNTSIPTSNPYDALKSLNEDDDSEEEDVENIFDESVNLFTSQTGASTPADIGFNSHVDVSIIYDTCRKVCTRWKWTSNGGLCTKGTRIILGWNDDNVDIMIMAQTNQVMHCQINTRGDNRTIFCSFIYADNYYVDRRALWNNLAAHGSLMLDKPWVLLGDFNAALNLKDHLCGGYEPNISMREFKECVQRMEVMDVNATGLHFTWNQKPKGDHGTLKKIDRIMSNVPFIDEFPGSFAIFQPYRISDHTPCVLRIPKVCKLKPKPFKFSNFLVHKERFRDVVANGWNLNINGCAMFRLVKRLKGLKSPLRKLLYDQGNLHARVTQIRGELDEVQKAIDLNPSCTILREDHAHYLLAFKEASLDEERFLRQKSKIEWLDAGDSNTAYFHNVVKSRNARNRIEMVKDMSNIVYEGNEVAGAFVSHYEQFLGVEGSVTPLDNHDLFSRVLDVQKAAHMVRNVSDAEIKSALFSMSDDKAPGPDGFTAAFFKKAWDIVGDNFSCAIRDFFSNGKLLREVNHTIIALIPKVTTPCKINDYRPISCCNITFKCISKIIANRIKGDLGDLVSINQSAFVPGRRISDNILLTQELMRNYHRNCGPPRCSFKVDIQKAYDTVDWGFLRSILIGFGFHPTMIEWIMVCVSTTSYSVCINGNLHGWFNGKRGLRQGDPLSPYLFTLVMEVLTLLLQRRVSLAEDFRFHHHCEKQRIINLCFADDLFLFARGHLDSVSVIMDTLEEFMNVSGLVPSIPKSTTFFCNVPIALKSSILNLVPFAEGTLPVRYLGVPLISSRLLYHDCKVLVEKLESRVNDWRNKFLSLAGRMQLVRSVLSSMHIYWASVFILPVRIISDLE
ncbi:uncharacterized protein Tco_1502051 [Tanacetum coccineum]